MNVVHEDPEPQLMERPKKRRRTEATEDSKEKRCARRQKTGAQPLKRKYLHKGLSQVLPYIEVCIVTSQLWVDQGCLACVGFL